MNLVRLRLGLGVRFGLGLGFDFRLGVECGLGLGSGLGVRLVERAYGAKKPSGQGTVMVGSS